MTDDGISKISTNYARLSREMSPASHTNGAAKPASVHDSDPQWTTPVIDGGHPITGQFHLLKILGYLPTRRIRPRSDGRDCGISFCRCAKRAVLGEYNDDERQRFSHGSASIPTSH
jgi:hypothetical protein